MQSRTPDLRSLLQVLDGTSNSDHSWSKGPTVLVRDWYRHKWCHAIAV